MVQCSVSGCANEATNQCSKCKTRFYCGTACQSKDWTAGHKRDCKRIVAALSTPGAASSSPYGMVVQADGTSKPISHSAQFFSDSIYNNPEVVYRELIGAFHVLIDATLSCRPGECVPGCDVTHGGTFANAVPAQHQAAFATWAELARKSGMMPDWWTDAHQEKLKVFAREDADWGFIARTPEAAATTAMGRSRTRILSREQVQRGIAVSQAGSQRIIALEMMLERVATFEGQDPLRGHAVPAGGWVIQTPRDGGRS